MDVNPQQEKKEALSAVPVQNQIQSPKQQTQQTQQTQKKKEDKVKKKPACSRCKNPNKAVRKHHYPLHSGRMAFLCDHCYIAVRKQRKRARKFGHF